MLSATGSTAEKFALPLASVFTFVEPIRRGTLTVARAVARVAGNEFDRDPNHVGQAVQGPEDRRGSPGRCRDAQDRVIVPGSRRHSRSRRRHRDRFPGPHWNGCCWIEVVVPRDRQAGHAGRDAATEVMCNDISFGGVGASDLDEVPKGLACAAPSRRIRTPWPPLGMAAVPSALVPMAFPWIVTGRPVSPPQCDPDAIPGSRPR